MARSLSIQQEEVATTHSLFNIFLALSMLWLVLSAVGGAFASSPAPEVPESAP